MRKLLATLVALLSLAAPASAHTDYKSVTLGTSNGSLWSNTVLFGQNWLTPACWAATGIGASGTTYIYNAYNYAKFGIARIYAAAGVWHVHPPATDTGANIYSELRSWTWQDSTRLDSRRVNLISPAGNYIRAVKYVNRGPGVVVVRIHC